MAKSVSLPPILLIEDSPDDFEATQRSFKKVGLENPLHWCTNGQEGLDYLKLRGPRPALVLLDLNMPGISGRAVLETIKQDKALRSVPVLILTTSNDARDVARCYDLGANTYIQKPVDVAGLVQVAACIRDYWFGTALLPKEEEVP